MNKVKGGVINEKSSSKGKKIAFIIIILIVIFISIIFVYFKYFRESETFIDLINSEKSFAGEYYPCLAMIHDDPSFCPNIKNTEGCKETYNWDASFFKDESFCGNLPGERENVCLAYQKNDSSLCSNIRDTSIKNYCLGLVNQDFDSCDLVSEKLFVSIYDCKSRIKMINAINNQNIELCEEAKYGDVNFVGLCKAVILKDEELCSLFIEDLFHLD